MLEAIQTDDTMKEVIRQRVLAMRRVLSAWLRKGCPQAERATVTAYLELLRSRPARARSRIARRRQPCPSGPEQQALCHSDSACAYAPF
jgi:hypothetical protein